MGNVEGQLRLGFQWKDELTVQALILVRLWRIYRAAWVNSEVSIWAIWHTFRLVTFQFLLLETVCVSLVVLHTRLLT